VWLQVHLAISHEEFGSWNGALRCALHIIIIIIISSISIIIISSSISSSQRTPNSGIQQGAGIAALHSKKMHSKELALLSK
jgi:hypothetical protein